MNSVRRRLVLDNAYSAVDQSQSAAAAVPADQPLGSADAAAASVGGITISLTVGSSQSRSKTTLTSSTASGSSVTAGRDVNISATGAGSNSDLTIQGSRVSGGRDVSLIAEDALSLLAARNTAEQHSTNSASSANVGVAATFGSGGMAIGVTVSASGARGRADGSDVSWTNARVEAGDTLMLQSGGDTTLRGAVARGRQVIADVLGDLHIESLQDTSVFDSKQTSVGGSVTIGWGFAAGSASFGNSRINSNYASVREQSGIGAGDGGFQINVGGNTDLRGAAIASSDRAAAEGRNRLTTGSLTTSDIENRADYRGSSIGLSGGYGVGVGLNQQGQATTGAGQVPGTQLGSVGGFSAAPPMALSARDSAGSTTRSGISPADVQITDQAKQQALTGRDAPATIASINRDVTTGRDTSGALAPIFNEQEIQAGFAITGAFSREVGAFVNNRTLEAATLRKQAEKETDPLKQQALLIQAYDQELKWGPGGTYRQIATAISAAAAGNVTGSATQMLQSAAINYVQSLGVEQVKQIADSLRDTNGQTTATSETVRGALQAIVACAGAAAQSQSCGAGALSASASVALNELLKPAQDDPASQEARKNIAATIIGGIASAAGVDNIQTLVNASVLETDNNALNLPPATRRALGGALGVAASLGSIGEIVKPEFWRGLNALATSGDAIGLIRMGIELTVAERKQDYAMFERLNDEFGKGMVVGRSTADVLMIADAIAALPMITAKLAQLGGSVLINGVRYTQVGARILRDGFSDIRQGSATLARNALADLPQVQVKGTVIGPVDVKPGDPTKVAVIARSMEAAEAYASALRRNGVEVRLFSTEDLTIPTIARNEWEALRVRHGGRIPEQVLPSTRMFQTNEAWAQLLNTENYTVINLGNPFKLPGSPFFNMEQQVIFGAVRH